MPSLNWNRLVYRIIKFKVNIYTFEIGLNQYAVTLLTNGVKQYMITFFKILLIALYYNRDTFPREERLKGCKKRDVTRLLTQNSLPDDETHETEGLGNRRRQQLHIVVSTCVRAMTFLIAMIWLGSHVANLANFHPSCHISFGIKNTHWCSKKIAMSSGKVWNIKH